MLQAVTRYITPEQFEAITDGTSARFVWHHQDRSLVGLGAPACEMDPGIGESRFARAAIELEDLFEHMRITDEVAAPGTGAVAFASFTFDELQPGSSIVVPEAVAGRDSDRCWLTVLSRDGTSDFDQWLSRVPRRDSAPVPAGHLQVTQPDAQVFLKSVELALAAIARGELEKVVLAMPFEVASDAPLSADEAVRRLRAQHPDAFVFRSQDFVGASPELLVRRMGLGVRSAPLAGSARRGESEDEDDRIGEWLLSSEKQLWEHEIAKRTVTRALEVLCEGPLTETGPHILRLRDVMHLATVVEGELNDSLTALDIAGAIHPSAAVCGWPREPALATIRRVEPSPRGRYAGPVGWMDVRGDGEFAIALRCAEIRDRSATLWAGAGVVRGSDPREELEEVRLKARTMLGALP